MTVLMMITADRYELPIVVADNFRELAQRTGMDVTRLYKSFRKGTTCHRMRDGLNYRIIKVEIGDINE